MNASSFENELKDIDFSDCSGFNSNKINENNNQFDKALHDKCADINDDEKKLVEAARNGDSLAITLLVVKYRSFLDKYVGLLNVPEQYKEDLIQEGFIGLLKAVHSFDKNHNCSFQTFAKHCIRNSVISELRLYSRRGIGKEIYIDDLSEGMFEVVTNKADNSTENIYIDIETSAQLHDTIFSVLSTYEAKVFGMYLAEIPYSLIASRLGKDIKSIDNAIQRIKNKLKKLV
ncbi:MAG: sigma-70 family RNA polymerase sigma factor [Ruminococcaceae bacterium]|nr:sigma-70 family RNA polymerase sigma factor [Oscillospiraceae bacterium]